MFKVEKIYFKFNMLTFIVLFIMTIVDNEHNTKQNKTKNRMIHF